MKTDGAHRRHCNTYATIPPAVSKPVLAAGFSRRKKVMKPSLATPSEVIYTTSRFGSWKLIAAAMH